MSCPDRTLVTKSEVTHQGTSANPLARVPEVSTEAGECDLAPQPCVCHHFGLPSGVSPNHFFPPSGLPLNPLVISYSHLHFHRNVPCHLFSTSATWTSEGVFSHTFTCRYPQPSRLCRGQESSLIRHPAPTEAVSASECVRPSVNVGRCVCSCYCMRLSVCVVSVSAGFCPSITVGVCSTAAGLSVASVTACLSVCQLLFLASVWAPGSLGLGSEGG